VVLKKSHKFVGHPRKAAMANGKRRAAKGKKQAAQLNC